MKRQWIKLSLDILDDPKMGMMPDWLFRRAIELFLLAGENGDDGLLQPVTQLAWRLRLAEAKMIDALRALSEAGVVHETPEGWVVTNFRKRQYSESYERVRRLRERERYRNGECNGDRNGDCNENVPSYSSSLSDSESSGGGGAGGGGAAERVQYEQAASRGDANRVLTRASGMAALSGSLVEKIDAVQSLLARYGAERTQSALSEAREQWTKTRRKDNSGTYSVLNGAWVDWAIAHLAGETPWKGAGQSAIDRALADLEKHAG